MPKNWCFWTVVLEKTLEGPLDCKKIQPVHPKGNQSWIFIRRTDAEAEAPILWLPDRKNWKRRWCWEKFKVGEEGEDRGWDGWVVSLTQWTWVWVGSGSWWWTKKPSVLKSMGHKESNKTELLTWTELIIYWTGFFFHLDFIILFYLHLKLWTLLTCIL